MTRTPASGRRRALRTARAGWPELARGLLLTEPSLRNAFLRAREPRIDDNVSQLAPFELREIRNADEDRGVTVEVRSREEDATRVGETSSFASAPSTRNMTTSSSRSPVSGSTASRRRPRWKQNACRARGTPGGRRLRSPSLPRASPGRACRDPSSSPQLHRMPRCRPGLTERAAMAGEAPPYRPQVRTMLLIAAIAAGAAIGGTARTAAAPTPNGCAVPRVYALTLPAARSRLTAAGCKRRGGCAPAAERSRSPRHRPGARHRSPDCRGTHASRSSSPEPPPGPEQALVP